MSAQQSITDKIFALSTAVQYVALYRGGSLTSHQRPKLGDASASESDRYEELFVNPTLLTLAHQRGNLDCGGARFVLVGYGNFHQLMIDLSDGHISVCFKLASSRLDHVEAIQSIYENT